ncbi:serine/threonine-protein kinase [Acrocarpospora catenulata]|uniref:serine/threonine-protein kinase n=1 Tax=Acrocarpospora catenulata TaxID=2836182 RepID=UPI001BDABD9B|nr:serine/threonine-protein kinase [Acrocarpospora catenulata]
MEPTGAEPLTPQDPAAIGPYRLLGRLGEGGMGTVYLAVAPTGRLVAVKVVKAQFTMDDDFAGRFHGEVENARKVASFCTAQVLDNGNTERGQPYMVTEYIAGIPLSRQIAQFGPLDPGPLHGVALGVAAALAAIHVAGLVHRDLKPANVILSMSGPRVIDFGIARALDATHGFTQSGELLGSPGWWAPEQVRGEDISPWTDIFAWGCLVAYAGSGRHPYGRGDAVTLAARVIQGRPDLGTLPPPLDELARRATHPDPFQRPTAQDLLIALVGGSIAAPATPQNTAQSTLVATNLLTESWQAPPNVAEQPDATQILARAAQPTAVQTPSPAPPVPPAPLPEPDQIRIGAPPTGSDPGALTAMEQAWRSVGTDPRGALPYSEDTPTEGGRPPRSSRMRWLLAAGVVVLALSVSVVVLLTNRAGDTTAGGPARTPPSPVASAPPRVGEDVGRQIALGDGYDLHLVIPQQPRCDLKTYEGATAEGTFCVVRWTMLNTGGELKGLNGAAPVLVDDTGAEHPALESSTTLPTALKPGGKTTGVLVFDLPTGRTPARLAIAENVEVQL